MTATNVSVCVPQGFSRLIPQVNNTLQTSAPTHDVHGRQSVFFVESTWASDSRLNQLDVSVPHKNHSCAWQLRGYISAWLHRDVTLAPACDLMGVPYFHESSKSVSVSAMFRTRTVLFRLPGHPVLLCLLGDFYLHQVPELWLGKRRKPSPRHVCDCCMHARRVPFLVFLVLSSQFLRHGSQIVDHPLAKNTLAVATLVITIAGPLRTDTLDCRRISPRSPCASWLFVSADTRRQYVCTSKDLKLGCMEYL